VGDFVVGYDDTRFGGHSEYKIANHKAILVSINQNNTLEKIAPLTEGAHYALCNIRATKVEKGDIVLVYGATGAIGTAAVQLLKVKGAIVTAVSNTKNLDLVKSLGADEVIDYQTQDFTKTDKKFDFIFDAVGKSSFKVCKHLLKPTGVYISTELGKRSANVFLAIRTSFSKGKKVLFPLPTITIEDVEFLRDLYQTGKLNLVIDRIYELDDIVEAHKYVDSGQKTGNVVIKIRN